MRGLVTGGAGFIGSNLVAGLLAEGHEVTVLDNLSSGHRENLDGLAAHRFIEGDIRDKAAVARAMAGADVVFHLAASVGNKRSIDHPIEDGEVNVIGTLTVLEAARAEGVRKVVASSSAGIYGEPRAAPIGEDHPQAPLTPYAISKLCMEQQCLAYGRLHRLEVVCLRYFNVYGRHQRFDAYGNVIPIFTFNMLAGEPITVFGDGRQRRDFVDVRDVVRANIKAATAPGASGAYNIASGTDIDVAELIGMLEDVSGLEAQVRYADPRPGDISRALADISAAGGALGYAPVIEIRRGLADYMAWASRLVAARRPAPAPVGAVIGA